MRNNTKFEFQVSVSDKYYRIKPSGKEYSTMKWNKKKVSVSQFVSLVMTGYSYCHIFYKKLYYQSYGFK